VIGYAQGGTELTEIGFAPFDSSPEEDSMDDELIGQMSDISGGHAVICDLCGRLTTSASRIVLSGRIDTGDLIEEVRACANCRHQLDVGELPVESLNNTERKLMAEK